MSKGIEIEVKCLDEKDREEKRVARKKQAKIDGEFLRCEGNTILLTGGDRITFVIDDEHLPPEAFRQRPGNRAGDTF
ncbi:MAG: hypothetical protein WC374_04795 [Phycisphaerae bacterium]|jgi:hypothetical protein